MKRRVLYAGLALGAAVAMSAALQGCKLVKNDPAEAGKSSDAYADAGFDPNAMVASMWQPKVLPSIEKRATDLGTLHSAIAADADGAGKKYGFRGKDDGAPWNFPVKLQGTVVEADVDSSQGTIGVDTDGDGKADATVDIGPTMLGTALRDSLDFVSFQNFKNQIDYARFGTALNIYTATHVLNTLPRKDLKGKTISVTGTFVNDGSSELPEVIPVAVSLGGGKS
jgi:predicted lipoprotein